jgi:hypothetical protein
MILNPSAVLNPVFNALDSLIENYGVYLYLGFVWLALLVIGWILSGGLRRKQPHGNSAMVIPAIIFTMQPPMQSPPRIIGIKVEQTWNDDDETMDEPSHSNNFATRLAPREATRLATECQQAKQHPKGQG